MRSFLTFAAAAASTFSTAAATVGRAYVTNNCDFDVSVWSVGGQISGPYRLWANSGTYGETYSKDPQSGGRVFKVTIPEDGLWTGAPQTNFAYNLDGEQIWYDMSDVFGDPFAGHKLLVTSNNEDCDPIVWEDGVPPGGSQVKVCTSEADLKLILCA